MDLNPIKAPRLLVMLLLSLLNVLSPHLALTRGSLVVQGFNNSGLLLSMFMVTLVQSVVVLLSLKALRTLVLLQCS